MALFSYPVCTWLCQYVNMGVRKWLEKSAEKQKYKLCKTLNPLSRKAFRAVSFSATKDKSEQALYRLLRFFFAKVRARSRRCSSFPNRTLCAGLRFGFGHESESFIMYSAWIFHVAAKCTLRPRLFCNQYKSTLLHSPPFKIDSILLPVFS